MVEFQASNPKSFVFSDMMVTEKETLWLGKNYDEILKNILPQGTLVMKNE